MSKGNAGRSDFLHKKCTECGYKVNNVFSYEIERNEDFTIKLSADMLYTLSEFLAGFAVSKSRINYYIDVLGSATYQTIVGIPASPISTISYAFIAPLRKKFSTKAIWIL